MTTSAATPPPAAPGEPAGPAPSPPPPRQPPPRSARVTFVVWVLAVGWAGVALFRWVGLQLDSFPFAFGPALVPYAAVGALLPLGLALGTRRWLAAGIAFVALGALVGAVAPRAFGQPDPVRGPVVRVLTANLNEGHADPAAVLDLARAEHADLLAVEEVTEDEEAALQGAGLSDLFPFAQSNAHWTSTGTALYSRYPLTDGGRRRLMAENLDTYATVRVPGAAPVVVNVIHYCAPVDPYQAWCWADGVHSIPAASPKGDVRLTLGDFNLTLDYPAMQNLLGTGYRDAASVVGKGLVPTWPYDGKPLPKITIDHVLADPRIGVSAVGVHQLQGSDHRAVSAVLSFPRS
jgi:endonuclease/exonuclease/phosphatase (EEP) superfamily protein YafD